MPHYLTSSACSCPVQESVPKVTPAEIHVFPPSWSGKAAVQGKSLSTFCTLKMARGGHSSYATASSRHLPAGTFVPCHLPCPTGDFTSFCTGLSLSHSSVCLSPPSLGFASCPSSAPCHGVPSVAVPKPRPQNTTALPAGLSRCPVSFCEAGNT